MTGYTKLFHSILTSTIWQEDAETKVVWVTLLALADANGTVDATVPGLANMARVSIEKTEEAIAKFLAPDPYSRTQTDDGRRIMPVEGGWLLLNHAAYRRKRDAEERREYLRRKQAERRERLKQEKLSTGMSTNVNNVSGCSTMLSHTEEEEEEEAEEVERRNSKKTEFQLSSLLFQLIQSRKSDFKRPHLATWAKHIDRMIRIDKRIPERIEAVIRWCQADPFWQNNILGTAKLRKQFDQLELKMKKTRGQHNGRKPERSFDDQQSQYGESIESTEGV